MMFSLLFSLSYAQDELPAYEELVPDTPSYQTARKRMYKIHEEQPTTLYCGCSYSSKEPDLDTCGLGESEGLRWERTEVEHVVPAATIGETRPCWEEGGRDRCLDVDKVFYAAHSDLHNLYPSVGHLNAIRGNKGMGLVPEEPREFGTCDFERDEESDRVEPRPEVRGDVARIYFYMEWMYGVDISEGQRRLLMHWHQSDPVDDWERQRDEAIEAKQGNSNPFVR